MTELAYRVVDVFSDRPLAGNALCVVLDPCPEEAMAALAREVNLSETTFPTLTAPYAYDVRFFTPRRELPFAGHPTLGTAWVLGAGTWAQTSPGATVTVEVDAGGARMAQPAPTLEPRPAPDVPGLPNPAAAWVAEAGGTRHLIVATEAPIDAIEPDLAAVRRATDGAGAQTLAVVRRLDDAHLHVRVFAPSAGISEDPGTGSAAGPVTIAAAELWGTSKAVTIRQGDEIGRPCRIEVELGAGGPLVGGRVSACAAGRFTLGNMTAPR